MFRFLVCLALLIILSESVGFQRPWDSWSYNSGRKKRSIATRSVDEASGPEYTLDAQYAFCRRAVKRQNNNKKFGAIFIRDSNGEYTCETRSANVTIEGAVEIKVFCGKWEVCGTDYETYMKEYLTTSGPTCNTLTLDSDCACAQEGVKVAVSDYKTIVMWVRLVDKRRCPDALMEPGEYHSLV